MIFQPAHDVDARPVNGANMGPRFGITFRANHVRTFAPKAPVRIEWDEIDDTEDPGLSDISDNAFDIRAGISDPVIQFIKGPLAESAYVKIHDNVVLSPNERAFVDISSDRGNLVRLSILDNQLTATMRLGTVANAEAWLARKMIGKFLNFDNLPSSNPGGTGAAVERRWNTQDHLSGRGRAEGCLEHGLVARSGRAALVPAGENAGAAVP